ncbi:SDR family NAD(P)-dependent oxidoreductase [Thermoanaerobacter uzonensis]|uniref:SDR family NAD(P)-dependent oxidoreductase n=1 Tax=Thermoanaerobacter uzonensis TaxID=447593 RepID=UPI003D769C74
MSDFSNKVVVITGGASGIGESVTRLFGERKAKVIVVDVNLEKANDIIVDIANKGGKGKAFKIDVTNEKEVDSFFNQVEKEYGAVDILVNSAGVVSTKPLLEINEKEFDFVISVNLKGILNMCKAVFPLMMKQKEGSIINISSVAAKKGGGIFGNAIYGASKAGVIALTKGFAREGAPYGIRVNAICPGPTETPMIKELMSVRKEQIIKSIPLGRFARPNEIRKNYI